MECLWTDRDHHLVERAEIDAATLTEGVSHITIGRPIVIFLSIYILDSHLSPAPIGVAAEMHIGGAG